MTLRDRFQWTKLEEEWSDTIFNDLDVDLMKKQVNAFSQTILLIEKGLPKNEVLPALKKSLMDFKQVRDQGRSL